MSIDLTRFAERLGERIAGRVETDVGLARFTTYRVGGPAAAYLEVAEEADVIALSEILREPELGVEDLPVLPLGRGSNLVISDSGFPGLVIRLGSSFSRIEALPDDRPGAKVGAATSMPQLANWAARRAFSGFEWAISIPGSVGGGVRMNAGAHGGEIADALTSVSLCKLDSFVTSEVPAEELGMTYRRTNLTERDLVLEAVFHFEAADGPEVKARMEAYREHRAATQPGALQNAGSVFKNPDGDSAGRLVESCGLKGFNVGGARVSELHANFFIAGDGASAQDVYDLVHEVRRRVLDQTGVELEPEIRFVGEFSERETS